MFEKSILLEISQRANINGVYIEPINTQVGWFKQTLTELEDFLDTGDLTQITPKSLSIIKEDLLNIIKGFRKIKPNKNPEIFNLVTSVDKILENLRKARNIVFTIDGMFSGKRIRDDKREAFFNKLSECRQYVALALKAFQ